MRKRKLYVFRSIFHFQRQLGIFDLRLKEIKGRKNRNKSWGIRTIILGYGLRLLKSYRYIISSKTLTHYTRVLWLTIKLRVPRIYRSVNLFMYIFACFIWAAQGDIKGKGLPSQGNAILLMFSLFPQKQISDTILCSIFQLDNRLDF